MDQELPKKDKLGFWDEKDLDDRYRDPRNWKWGMFYHNKKDERLFVPKPNPAHGSTVNFAHRLAILAFMTPLILIVILILLFFFGYI